ncbi:hypothetical protein MSA03_16060 [Microbacterium saccharophilum]|nr:hypothetical protein MSA03_16060 [Microbacterium saccharophilum]
MRSLIASGAGRYADPWHPFPRTTPLVSATLADAGFDVSVDDDVDRALTRLGGVDLLVLHAGAPSDDAPLPDDAAAGLAAAVARGIGILAVHIGIRCLQAHPGGPELLGGLWVDDVSWHPPLGVTPIRGGMLPGGGPIADFEVEDERYLGLQLLGERVEVAHHVHEGTSARTAWVREVGAARIAVDLLGHDERSYDSAGRRAMLAALAGWAARG